MSPPCFEGVGLRAPPDCDDLPALVAGDHIWTHAGLWDAAAQQAQTLASPEKGVVFVLCRNTPDTVIGILGARLASHAVALIDAGLDADRRSALVETYQPEWILDSGVQRGPGGPPPHPDLGILLSTSGSTGSPKLVRLSHRAVEANARSIAEALQLNSDERPIASLPLHYSYGLSLLHSHLVVGGCLVLTQDSLIQRTFWQTFDQQRCTSFAAVPYGFQMLRRVGLEKMDLPTLRHLTQAGGKLAPELIARYHSWITGRGGKFWVMYGQTEATARIAILPADRLPGKLGTAGQVIPGGTLRIDDGEVIYEGPNVMMGYAESRADLARGDDLGGALRTGDHGHIDDEGFLTITGRSRRIGKVFGLRVNLDEIEALLRPHGPTAVLGGVDELVIFCEWGDDDAFGEHARSLAARLRLHHRAFAFRRVSELPLTANGKVDYRRLQDS